jgi:hypothetical protein
MIPRGSPWTYKLLHMWILLYLSGACCTASFRPFAGTNRIRAPYFPDSFFNKEAILPNPTTANEPTEETVTDASLINHHAKDDQASDELIDRLLEVILPPADFLENYAAVHQEKNPGTEGTPTELTTPIVLTKPTELITSTELTTPTVLTGPAVETDEKEITTADVLEDDDENLSISLSLLPVGLISSERPNLNSNKTTENGDLTASTNFDDVSERKDPPLEAESLASKNLRMSALQSLQKASERNLRISSKAPVMVSAPRLTKQENPDSLNVANLSNLSTWRFPNLASTTEQQGIVTGEKSGKNPQHSQVIDAEAGLADETQGPEEGAQMESTHLNPDSEEDKNLAG